MCCDQNGDLNLAESGIALEVARLVGPCIVYLARDKSPVAAYDSMERMNSSCKALFVITGVD